MAAVPALIPETMPPVASTDAIVLAPVVHVPPDGELLQVTDEPTQTDEEPEGMVGLPLTAIPTVVKQPVGKV
jgi:hypothetical protein